MNAFLEENHNLLGLGDDEARIHKFLNSKGEATAKDISYQCEIPYSQIHKALYRLQNQELIISRGDAPKLFALKCRDPELTRRLSEEKGAHTQTGGNQNSD